MPQSWRSITDVYLFWQNPLLPTQPWNWNFGTSMCIFITHYLMGNILLAAQQQFIPLKIQNLFEVWRWGQNFQDSFRPCELLNTFPLNVTPLVSNILNVISNNRCHVHLKPLKKTDFDAGIYDEFFSSNFPHSWLYSFHSTQPEDTSLRFLATTLATIL